MGQFLYLTDFSDHNCVFKCFDNFLFLSGWEVTTFPVAVVVSVKGVVV